MGKKVLIVKLGYTETIDQRLKSDTVSLGDVFRTTAILHIFKNDNVTWLTTKEGGQLLAGNAYIKRVLIYDPKAAFQLRTEDFDIVVNLERLSGICALTDSIHAQRRYGFRFNEKGGKVEACEHSYEVLANSDDPDLRRKMKKHWIEVLYEMVGEKWNGEGYILGYKPRTSEKYDIGFNVNVNKRWSNKAWPRKNWRKLERLFDGRYSISYQKSLDDIHGYIDWLNSCGLIITNDSLGLHLSVALKKKIIALFGPTSEKEIHFFEKCKVIRYSTESDCAPCFNMFCGNGKPCMEMISPEVVYDSVETMMGR
ncbi:MAG: glycosyltransferase family 9 protein [Candidatus Omnitrophica bacterium]|nr:glycosyltransferase family 9 protein [Candidatus Omnitrophota bacterium]